MNEIMNSGDMAPAEAYAIQINTIKRETARICLAASVEIGRILVLAKEAVPHGEWGNWLEENVNYSQSTAGNLMKLYREYGEQSQIDFFEVNKMEIFGSLSPSQALALLALPSVEARQEFVETHEMEELSVRELEKEIEELKAKLEDETERADGTESELSDTKKELSRAKAALQAAAHDKGNTADLQKKVRELEKQKKDEKAKADIQISALEKALKDAEAKAAEAQQISFEPQIQRVEVAADVEKDPKYIELMKRCEGLVNQLKLADTEGIRFRMEFDRLQDAFGSCVGLIAGISKTDAETGMKLRNATVSALEQMMLALTSV